MLTSMANMKMLIFLDHDLIKTSIETFKNYHNIEHSRYVYFLILTNSDFKASLEVELSMRGKIEQMEYMAK